MSGSFQENQKIERVGEKGTGQNLIWHYQAVRESWHNPDLGQYLTYGLRVQRKTGLGWEEIGLIHDVTTQHCFGRRLAKLFSRHQLSPLHFRDVIEDMLP